MQKGIVVLVSAGIAFLAGHCLPPTAAAGAAMVATESFLDLPDGFGISADDDDDIEGIDIYTQEIEGDAFFFCLDRSSSMAQATQSGAIKFEVLKREVIRALQGLSARSRACVHFYDGSVAQITYGDPPLRMDVAAKARLAAEVAATPLSKGSCLVRGMEKVLAIANATDSEYRTIVLIGDGRTQCSNDEQDPERVYQRIIAKNVRRIPINTIYTGPRQGDDAEIGMPLLQRLARTTNGQFRVAH